MNLQKGHQKPRLNSSKTLTLGIPRALANRHREKITEVLPVKVQYSVKLAVKELAGEHHVSTWIREAIIMRLQAEGPHDEEQIHSRAPGPDGHTLLLPPGQGEAGPIPREGEQHARVQEDTGTA